MAACAKDGRHAALHETLPIACHSKTFGVSNANARIHPTKTLNTLVDRHIAVFTHVAQAAKLDIDPVHNE